MVVGQQAVERHRLEAGIAAVAFAVVEGELLGFDKHVHAFSRGEFLQIEALDDLQHLEHHEARGVGRCLAHLKAAIGDRDRCLHLGGECSQILLGDQDAGIAHAARQALGELPAIKCLGTVRGDLLERAC